MKRRNEKTTIRSNRKNGHITEDERLLHRPTQPLVSPEAPTPPEKYQRGRSMHWIERSLMTLPSPIPGASFAS